MEFGICNGVYSERNYDHIETIRLATGRQAGYRNFRVDVVQLYLNPQNLNDKLLLEKIAEEAKRSNIKVITHIHGLPEKNEIENLLNSHSIVLKYQREKKTVVHYNEPLENLLSLIEGARKRGIKVFIENYHQGVEKIEEYEKHKNFVNFVTETKEVGAVLDIGRYFLNSKEVKVKKIVEMIVDSYRKFVNSGVPVFFHTIGTRSYKQERKDWVAVMSEEDVIPQKMIFKRISLYTKCPLIIVELENVSQVVESIKNLQEFFKQLQPF